MWVLTRSINEYNQDGDYLICVFSSKPTVEKLIEIFGISEKYAKFLILEGGGREDSEDEWWYLSELEDGELYKSKDTD